ncbi:hypothetical protein FACS189459_5990 [Bacilli bacterium]|nr:hypothetical protein FACS189459_5990 [Bacilli bacterium]
MPYKNICRMIEKTYNLQLREGAKILFAAIENANIQRLKSNK